MVIVVAPNTESERIIPNSKDAATLLRLLDLKKIGKVVNSEADIDAVLFRFQQTWDTIMQRKQKQAEKQQKDEHKQQKVAEKQQKDEQKQQKVAQKQQKDEQKIAQRALDGKGLCKDFRKERECWAPCKWGHNKGKCGGFNEWQVKEQELKKTFCRALRRAMMDANMQPRPAEGGAKRVVFSANNSVCQYAWSQLSEQEKKKGTDGAHGTGWEWVDWDKLIGKVNDADFID